MTFAITLLATTAICCALRNPIRRAPWVFYLLAVAAVVAYFAVGTSALPAWASVATLTLMRKCMLPAALFVIVMYVGVFPKGSKVRRWLQPLRAPLSIVASILVLGHMVQYFMVYAPRVLDGQAVSGNVMVSFAMAIALFALLLVLGVTSFDVVKRSMSTVAWKRLQRLAYPFYALIYVHLLIMLGPAAAIGRSGAIVGIAVYTVVFGAYLVLRVLRARADAQMREGREALAEEMAA